MAEKTKAGVKSSEVLGGVGVAVAALEARRDAEIAALEAGQ